MNEEYLFNFDNELVNYVNREVKRYINKGIEGNIIYSYNRMTIEEITQECLLKLIRSNNGNINKAYVRKVIRHTCIDLYRKSRDVDLDFFVQHPELDTEDLEISSISHDEVFEDVILESELKNYEPLQQDIIILKLQGYSNVEIKDMLGIAHDTFYRYLRKIKSISY